MNYSSCENSTAFMSFPQFPYERITPNTTTPHLQFLPTSSTNEIYRSLPPQQWENNHPSAATAAAENMFLSDIEEISQPERAIAGFVSKLYQCLQVSDDGHKYARWCKHNGTDMFIIDCIPKFTEIVLPRFFKHCKFASFVRQLNIYGFQRDTDARKSKDSKDKETCRWFHTYFRPGCHELFHLIRRKTLHYSRRKRSNKVSSGSREQSVLVVNEENSESVLSIMSGDDDSDSNYNHSEDILFLRDNTIMNRRLSSVASSSSTSSSNTLRYYNQQQQQINDVEYTSNRQQLHSVFQNSQNNNSMDPVTCLNQKMNCPTPTSSIMEEQQQQVFFQFPSLHNNEHMLHMAAAAGVNECVVGSSDSSSQQYHSKDNTQHEWMTQHEDQLRLQVSQLRKSHDRMYQEVNKAYSLVEAQRARIEYLENQLNNSQLRHSAAIYIDTQPQSYNSIASACFNSPVEQDSTVTNMLSCPQQLHTAPNTPIYHQPLKHTTSHNSFLQQHVERLSSPGSSVSEKWASSSFHSMQQGNNMPSPSGMRDT